MSLLFLATIGGVSALFFWGISDYFAAKSGQKLDAAVANLILQFAALLLITLIFLFYRQPITASLLSVLTVAVVSVLFTAAYVSYIRALSVGPLGIAAPLANTYALFTLLIGILFFGAVFSKMQLAALLTIIIGAIMLTFANTTFGHKKIKTSMVYFAATAAVLWGIGFSLVNLVVTSFAWYQLLFLFGIFMTLASVIYYFIKFKKLPSRRTILHKNTKPAWLAGILLTVGSAGFFVAAERVGSVIIPAVIASASPLVTSYMAYLRDKEKLLLYQRLGALAVVIGLMLLNI